MPKIIVQRVSLKMDNETLCRPSVGYHDSIEIDPNHYEEVHSVHGELPESDLKWPKGAPIDLVKWGSKILRKKVCDVV